MGAFFTNIQVRAGADPERTREQIVEALRHRLREDGFVEPEAGVKADRSILIGRAGSWIAIYDEHTECQDENKLRDMAAYLSEVLHAAAMSILVHDSDVLRLAVFDGGRPLEIGEWARLLAPDRDVADFQSMFRKRKLFAEDTLGQLAELIDLDASQASLGYTYADKDAAQYTVLRFRSSVRPAHEQPSEADTRLEAGAHCPKLEVSAGSPLRAAFSVRNAGRASKGLEVVAWGEALAKKMLVLREVQILVGDPEGRRSPPVAHFERHAAKAGEELWVAAFPDLEIPACGAGLEALEGVDEAQLFEAMYRSNVHANLSGDVLASGEATFQIGFVPLAAPESGQFGYSCLVHAHAASRRPLRAPVDVDAHLLRPLDQRSTLFGLASCRADIEHAAEVATALIQRWGEILPEAGKYSITVFPARAGARPKTGSAQAKGFFASARWKKLGAELASESAVTAERQDSEAPDSAGFPIRRADGFAFGRSIVPRESADKDDPELATLALWMNLHGKDEPLVRGARALLTQAIDELMLRADGVQALIGTWAWQPSTLDTTPYEMACGVHGQCTLLRSWLTRFIRGVTDDWMWLGRNVLAHVNVARLEEVATIIPVATGVRLRLREESSLDALESVLAPLLPSGSDWQAGVNRYYRRG